MNIAYQIADSIVCPLGFSTAAVMERVVAGESALRSCGGFEPCEPVWAGMVDNDALDAILSDDGYTKFEKMAILSVRSAMEQCEAKVDISGQRVLFVLSTTKGNIELLGQVSVDDRRLKLWHSAEVIARYFGNKNTPVVISNACISGISAQIVANRQLASKNYDYVVTVGCDVLTKFVIAGFQSFKALSPEGCRPFDLQRQGLNLGEGAATIIYGRCDEPSQLPAGTVYISGGAITNDATHISAPARDASGLLLAIKRCGTENVDFVSTHGTATPYNDEMEALALHGSGLSALPAFSLKGYFGHTLGAAGLLETVAGAWMLKNNRIIPSRGYSRHGVTSHVNIVTKGYDAPLKGFLKTISGFGGCNAAIAFKKKE